MDSAEKLKQKPANHEFRVGTDAIRAQYRATRAAASVHLLEERTTVATALKAEASVEIPREKGYLVLPPKAFDVEDVIAAALDTVAHVNVEELKAESNKPFMTRLGDMRALTLDSPFLQFALRRDIVASAAAFLGLVPIIQFANVYHSSAAGDELAKSQLYHCDSDEVTQVKVFVFCEDVTTESGPLTVIPANLSQRVRDHTRYKYQETSFRRPGAGSLER